jgi:hypothetical protein
VPFTSRLPLVRVKTMHFQPREPAAPESYPTFWDEVVVTQPVAVVAPEDAYAAFVNLTEDDLRADLPDGD